MGQITTYGLQFEDGLALHYSVPYSTQLALFVDFYEKNEIPTTKFFYEPRDRVLDCGAGIGVVSCLIAKRAAFVAAVEALPEQAEMVRLNLGMNWCENSLIVNGALVADDRERATFNRRTLVYASSLQESHDEVNSVFEVGCVNVNTLVREQNLNCLHLDMEGGEIAIFDAVDLTPIDKVFFETHPYAYQQGDFERVVRRLLTAEFDPIFLGNPFGTSFPRQSCVLGFARRGQTAYRARLRFEPEGIYDRLAITDDGTTLEFRAG